MAHAALERHQVGVDDGVLPEVALGREAFPTNGTDVVLLLGVSFLVLFQCRLGTLYPVAADVTVVELRPGGTVLSLDVLHQQVSAREGQLAALGLADVRFDA